MRQITHVVLAVSIAFTVGCTGSKTVTTVEGDSVTNEGGLGTGSVAGVGIEVRDLATDDVAITAGIQTLRGPSGNYSRVRWEITLGKVLILLERDEEQPIELTVDDSFHGTLQAGDELVIDENRTVIVNGVERPVTARDFRDRVRARESTSDDPETPGDTDD